MSLKNDNRGLSLIEVLVVVAILAILAGASASAMGYLVRGNVKDASKSVYSMVASNQTYSKAKTGDWMLVCAHNGVQYVLTSECTTDAGVEVYEEKLMNNRITSIRVKDSLAGDYSDLMTLQFMKSTGAVKAINGVAVPKTGYADIEVAIGNNKAYLRLYYLTGEIEMH